MDALETKGSSRSTATTPFSLHSHFQIASGCGQWKRLFVHMPWVQLVSFPAPNPHAEKGLVTLERFLGCNCGKVSMSITCQYAHCYATWWLAPKQDCWPCTTTLPCNKMQYHMKIVELQSDWLARKQECWACKNQQNAKLSPDPFPLQTVGSGDETRVQHHQSRLRPVWSNWW